MAPVMGAQLASSVSTFRAFRGSLQESFRTYDNPIVSIDALLFWSTSRFTSVPVRHEARQHGRSNYTFLALVRHALNMLTAFSTVPLQAATLIGFLVAVFGIGVLLYVLGRWLIEGGSVPGFPFLASIIAIFSGRSYSHSASSASISPACTCG